MSHFEITLYLTDLFQRCKSIFAGNDKVFYSPDNGYLFTHDQPYFLNSRDIKSFDLKEHELVINLRNGITTSLQFAA